MSNRLLSLVVISLGACGRDAAPPPAKAGHEVAAAGHHKPCDYLSRADAEAATGMPLPKTNEDVAMDSCAYLTDEALGASLNFGPWEQVKMAAGAELGSDRRAVVTGVGDEALWRGFGHLYVRTGERGFLLEIDGPEVNKLPDEGLERVKALALEVLPKLQK